MDQPNALARHAIVTGAARGLGAAIARRLAAEGTRLTLVGRPGAALDAIAAELSAAVIHLDLADAEATVAGFAGLEADILVNNAGIAPTAPYAAVSLSDWQQTLAVNLTAAFLASQAVAPGMVRRGFGRIVNIASTAGKVPYRYVSAYVASKHGLIGLTRALALELARSGVTVNAICPGFADTDMVARAAETISAKTGRTTDQAKAELAKANPQGRLIDPAEVADMVAYLCGPAAASITGQSLVLAGGEVMA